MIFIPMALVVIGVGVGIYLLTRPNKSESDASQDPLTGFSPASPSSYTYAGPSVTNIKQDAARVGTPKPVAGQDLPHSTSQSPLVSTVKKDSIQPSLNAAGPHDVPGSLELNQENELLKKEVLKLKGDLYSAKLALDKATSSASVHTAPTTDYETVKKENEQMKHEVTVLRKEMVEFKKTGSQSQEFLQENKQLKDTVGQLRVEIGSLKGTLDKISADKLAISTERDQLIRQDETLLKELQKYKAGGTNPGVSAQHSTSGQKPAVVTKQVSPVKEGKPQVGVYICSCGGNISGAVDFDKIVQAAKSLEGVTVVHPHELFCGKEGQDLIAADISAGKVNRVVTIACSPKMHQKTFESVCERTGLNPYLLTMANIREQCVWMCNNKEQATHKTIQMLRAAVARSRYLESLPKKELEINPDVLVVGGGIAGVEAALELAKAGRKVYIVEKETAFGGILPQLEHTYPSGECAPCILAPRMKELLENESIKMFPSSAVKSAVGFGGNFTVTIEEKPRYVLPDKCISCLACIDDCPVSYKNTFNSGRDTRKAIDFLFPGSVPKAPAIDPQQCLRFKGQTCTKCKDACTFDAIDYEQKIKTHQINVGSVIIAIGAQLYDVKKVYPQINWDASDVLSGLDFERLTSTTGPTRGKILLKNGKAPQSVAVIHCVGSRTKKHLPYCSGICCKYSLKHSHAIKQQIGNCSITHLYSDLCIEGKKMQQFADDLAHHGVKFSRWQMQENGLADIRQEGEHLHVSGKNAEGKPEDLIVDMVILAAGLEPRTDMHAFEDFFFLNEKDGFVEVQHDKISAIATTAEGVYVIGTSAGPKDITQSVIEGKAAAGEILATYVPGRKLELEPMVAESNSDKCGGCQICVSLCPYHAISYDENKKTVVVSDILCKGCGTCTAACPTGAMKSKNFTYAQLLQEIKGALHE